MSKIAGMQVGVVVKEMRTTFATSLGSKTRATSVIVKITLDDGAVGVGEVPTSFVFPDETAERIKEILGSVKYAVGREIGEYGDVVKRAKKENPEFHMTCSGLEVALFRAWLASEGKNEFEYWGAKKNTIETDITIPFVPGRGKLDDWLERAVENNFRVYKVKVSGNVEEDISFLKMVWGFVAPKVEGAVIRLDGNQGYTAKSCLEMLKQCAKSGIDIELFEQPLKRDDYKGLAAIHGKTQIPVIVDETVFDYADCGRVIDNELADGINIKIAKSGIAQSAKIYSAAKRAKLKLMIGCMTETMVGLSAAINFAAGRGAFDYIDLDSVHFFAHGRKYGDIAIRANQFEVCGR